MGKLLHICDIVLLQSQSLSVPCVQEAATGPGNVDFAQVGLKRALTVKDYWDTLTDQQRTQALSLSLAFLREKAAEHHIVQGQSPACLFTFFCPC